MSKSLEILKKYKTTQFVISEICVDESKTHLTSEFAIEKIRSCLSKNNVSIEEYKQLEQDLERKEQLEIADRNNQNLVKTNVDLVNKNLELQKENQELIVNKNVAQAVAFDQKREIGELKDQIAYLKDENEGLQSAYEWSQIENSILKSENEELRSKYNDLMLDFKMFDFNTLKQEKEQLKNDIKLNEAQIDDLTLEVANYKHALEEKNEIIMDLKDLSVKIGREKYQLKKAIEILKNRGLTLYCGQHSHIPFISLKDCGDGVCISVEEANLLKEVLEC